MSRRMPPTPGRGALVRLDGARVVVALDLERDRQPVADRDDAGVLARAGDDALAGGRQRPEQRLGALVRAVLAPHDAEHRELEVVRVAPAEPVADRVELLVGDAQPAVERLLGRLDGSRLGHRHRAPTAAGVSAPDAARAALSTSERMMPAPSSEPRIASAARSGMGHQPGDVAARVDDPGDRAQRAVRVRHAIVLGGRPRPSRPRTGTGPGRRARARRASPSSAK